MKAVGKEKPAQVVEEIKEIPSVLKNVLRDGDVLITMGAGSISKLPHLLAEMKNV